MLRWAPPSASLTLGAGADTAAIINALQEMPSVPEPATLGSAPPMSVSG
jgi:hypothetical protein